MISPFHYRAISTPRPSTTHSLLANDDPDEIIRHPAAHQTKMQLHCPIMLRAAPLKRLVGAPTAILIGMGVAIGSGIFRTPGDVAGRFDNPYLILFAWTLGGVVALMQGMVTAELATRFPKAGGEYVFLREAYGEFVAFFFGWAYTVFIIGGGVATIALAFGDFGCELFSLEPGWSGSLATAAILVVMSINAMGLRSGARTQNVFTVLKVLALLGVVVVGFVYGTQSLGPVSGPAESVRPFALGAFLGAFISVHWAYDGTTDAVKLAEEIKDVRRALPRALIGAAASVTVLYVAVNAALLFILPLDEMAGASSVPGDAMSRLFGETGRRGMLIVAMLISLGALSSTVLATIRVTYALARDGLTFRLFARMSKAQAPVPALVVVTAFAIVLVLNRSFNQVLGIYFLATAVLFGLSYASLILFRLRETTFPEHVFRAPLGSFQACLLIILQLALAVYIARRQGRDAAYTALVLLVVGLGYFVWKFFNPTRQVDGSQ